MSAPVKPVVTMKEVDAIDVRVGTILEVEDVPASRKLVRLHVDFGDFTRHICVGFKNERENPKEVEGKQALFIVNLAPKEMAGVISEGMIFDIGYQDKIKPVLAIPEYEVPNGTRLG